MRGGGAETGFAGKGVFKSTNSLPFYDTSIGPTVRISESNSGSAREACAGQAPDNKDKTNMRAGPPTSAFHSAKLQRTADGGVPQELVEEPGSDTGAVGKKDDSTLQPEVVVTEPVPDVSSMKSPVEWPQGTPTTSVLRADIGHPQGPWTPVSPIGYSMAPARWGRSAGLRTRRDNESSISSITEASFHRDDRK